MLTEQQYVRLKQSIRINEINNRPRTPLQERRLIQRAAKYGTPLKTFKNDKNTSVVSLVEYSYSFIVFVRSKTVKAAMLYTTKCKGLKAFNHFKGEIQC